MSQRVGVPLILLLSVAGAACSGSSPSAPTNTSQPSYRGETLSAIDGRPIPGVAVKASTRSAVSDELGRFEVTELQAGMQTVTLTSPAIVERKRSVAIPSEAASERLIPASFDLDAFDQMMRGTGRLQRWMSAPSLVVVGSVMQLASVGADEHYATSEQLTDDEVTLLVEHLTEGLSLLTGQTFRSFASVEIERPSSGRSVNTLREGVIVVGRFRGIQAMASTVGLGRWLTRGTAEITGGSIYLDSSFDRSSDLRRLLRIHELGHALGYLHVTTRASIMNPSIGPQPTEFDRQAASIAFQRAPGNQSPDDDVTPAPRPIGIGGSLGPVIP